MIHTMRRTTRHCPPLLIAILSLLSAVPKVSATPPRLPQTGAAPLLFVRFMAPAGAKVTIHQCRAPGRVFPAPVTAGLRPGYVYRVKISHIPGRPGLALYPTLEVRGTLKLPKVIRAADHPAPAPISQEDIDRILRGALITKVVFLEHPDQALATATKPEQPPIELTVPAGADPIDESRTRGRPLLIMRLGERELTDDELACQAIPGTVLLPNDKGLPFPAKPPHVPFGCLPMIDPILGPKPWEEECLHDGGDVDPHAGFDRNGQVSGIDPSDTVAAYSDSRGRRHLAISNRVCLCVPRFLIMRGEIGLVGYDSVVTFIDRTKVEGAERLIFNQPSLQAQQNEQLGAMQSRVRPVGAISTQALERFTRIEVLQAYHVEIGVAEVLGTQRMHMLTSEQRTRLVKQIEFARQFEKPIGVRSLQQVELGPAVVGQVAGVKVVANVQELRDMTSSCDEPPRAPDQPLHLYKWASTHCGQVGDVVTFYLKYANLGGQPISDVAVTDSLTGRLEYISGSARSNRDAVFSAQENRAGSLELHWEITGRILPGQSGVVSFQARIR